METVVGALICIQDPGLAERAAVARREGRGLPIRQEMLDFMTTPAGQLAPIVFAVILSIAISTLLVLVHRSWHRSKGDILA